MLWPFTHPEPVGRVIKGKKSECSHVAYLIKGSKDYIEAKILSLLGQVEGQILKLYR